MEAVYNVFVSRVAAGRKMTAERVQPLAQGRVWVGTKAKELGLVDEIGGLDAALAEARKLGKVDDAIDVEVYPPAPTLRDLLAGWGQVHVPFGLSTQLDMIDPSVAKVAMRLLDLVESFRTTRIQTIAILPDIQ
jgi:protease-4